MAGNIKGITITFRGDTTQLDKALRSVDKETASIDSELKKVNNALKFNPTSVELWSQKQTLLKQKITETSDRLKALKTAQAQMDAKGVDKNSKEYRNLQREIITTESKLKNFKNQLKAIGSAKLSALGAQFKQIGQKMTAVGRSLSMYVTAPIVGIGTASVKAGASFDTAMSQVAATSGKTVKEITDLRDFAKQMGSTTAFSATQAAQGLNYMALAGYDAKKSMRMLPTVLSLAAAGSMDLAEASDMVTDAQTALGLSMDDTVKLVDQMAKTSSKSNTSVSQLGEAILKIGPTAKTMSGGTRELNQVLGVLADNGLKGSVAGTHLRNILLSLNTQKVKDAFHELGVEIFDAQGNMRDLSKIFPELSKAMDGLTNEERTGMLQKLFNKTDLSSLNALLDTSAERWEELGLAINDAGGSAEEMANTQLDNLQGSVTLLKSALEGAGIAISDVLAPYIKKLADFVSGLVSKFNELDPAIQSAIVIIGALAAAIGPVLVIAGMIAQAIGTILPLLAGISAPVLAIVAAVGALAAAFISVYASSSSFRKAINEIVTELVSAFKPVIDSVIKGVKTLVSEFGETVKVVGNKLGPVLTALMPIIKMVAKLLMGSLKRNIDFVIGVIRVLLAVVRSLAQIFRATFNAVVTIVTGAVSKIKNAFSKVKSAITGPFETAKNTIKGIVDKIKGFFPIHFGKIFSGLKLPHFTVDGGKFPFGVAGKGKPPKWDVNWYAKGGIFNNPSLIGVGEAGAEAVVPLDKLWRKLDEMNTAGMIVNVYGSDNMSVNDLAEAVEQKIIQMEKRRRVAWQ